MRRTSRAWRTLYIIVAIGLIVIILQYVSQSGLMGGNFNTISTTFITLFPYMGGMGLGLYFLVIRKKKESILNTTLIGGMLGIFNAGLFNTMNTNNIWIDDVVTATFTIVDLMTVVVLFWFFIGLIVGLIKN